VRLRIITGLVFALVIALFVIPGYWLPAVPLILFIFVAIVAARELVDALNHKGLQPSLPLITLGSMTMLVPLFLTEPFMHGLPDFIVGLVTRQMAGGFAVMTFCLMLAMTYAVVGLIIRRGPAALPDAVATAVIMAYIAFPLSCPVVLLFHLTGGWLWLVVGLVSPWISDVFAYFTGSLLGRHPIVPALSPKKTMEGCLGGLIGSILVTPLIFRLFGRTLGGTNHLDWRTLLFFGISGLLLSISAQLGDWLASGIKRWCGVKDFGRLLPGHGGLMDRFDSAFFTLPVTLLLAVLYERLFR
jgi:phosphatidate cytidylyltransferase